MAISDLINQIRELNNSRTQVGFFETSIYPDGTPVASVAATQEFGGVSDEGYTIPMRPFLRPAIATYKNDWVAIAKDGAEKMAAGGMDAFTVLDRVGLQMAGDVVKEIGEPKNPLSPVTLLLRQWRDDGISITSAEVHRAVALIKSGANVTLSANQTPLDDTGYMIASVQHEVVEGAII